MEQNAIIMSNRVRTQIHKHLLHLLQYFQKCQMLQMHQNVCMWERLNMTENEPEDTLVRGLMADLGRLVSVLDPTFTSTFSSNMATFPPPGL